ncbi:MAG: DNA primase [Bacillota bacterium]
MKYVPPEIVDEIRMKSDIVEIISAYVTLKRQGKNYVGLCPFHLEDTPSFTVSPEKQIFYCFGCQKGGSVITFIMEQENLTLPEAAEKLAEKVGIVIPATAQTGVEAARLSEKRRMYEMHELAADFFHANLLDAHIGKVARAYLDKRKITRDMIMDFHLGYAPASWDSLKNYLLTQGFTEQDMEKAGLISKSQKGTYYDRFRNRLMFPVWDYRGKVVAFGGRVMGDELPKYLNSPETLIFNKSQNLYGINLAATDIRKCDEAIIVEGYMDVVAARQFGINNTVASLGTSLTPDQGRLLKRYTSHVLISYDADTAGAKAAFRGLEILDNLGFRVRVLTLPNGLDPDEFLHRYNGKAWMQLMQNRAESFLEYRLHVAVAKHNIKTIEGKADVVKELLPVISRIKSQVEKDQYIKFIARHLDISQESIYAELDRKMGYLQNADNFIRGKHTNNTRFQVNEVIQRDRRDAYTIAQKSLCRLMIEDRETFDRVEKVLGFDFTDMPVLADVLRFVKKIYADFDWHPSTLVEKVDDAKLRQSVAELLLEEIPGEDREMLIRDYIKMIQLHKLKKRIKEIQAIIHDQEKKNLTSETITLLQEYTKLQQQVQQLKN